MFYTHYIRYTVIHITYIYIYTLYIHTILYSKQLTLPLTLICRTLKQSLRSA